MLALPLLALLACESPPPAYTPDLSAWTGAEAECLQAACAASASEELFAACRADQCAAREESWVVNPSLLRYDEGVVTMSVQVEHTPGGHGKIDTPRVGDTWLGATVLTSKGEEIDMAVQTVFPDRLDEAFTFSAEVGPDVADVIVGLWGKKIEPCDSTRSGCRIFGFVLDDSLAAWPPATYVEAPPRRQRFLPGAMTVQLSAAAMAPERQAALTDAMATVWASETQRFGTNFAVSEPAVLPATEGVTTAVVHKHDHDGPLASRVAATLGADVPVRHDPAAVADLVVALGATACPPGLECK